MLSYVRGPKFGNNSSIIYNNNSKQNYDHIFEQQKAFYIFQEIVQCKWQ